MTWTPEDFTENAEAITLELLEVGNGASKNDAMHAALHALDDAHCCGEAGIDQDDDDFTEEAIRLFQRIHQDPPGIDATGVIVEISARLRAAWDDGRISA